MTAEIITLADISVFNGEPTIPDLKLAEMLGYEKTHNIRDLIKRNTNELGKYGEVFATMANTPEDNEEVSVTVTETPSRRNKVCSTVEQTSPKSNRVFRTVRKTPSKGGRPGTEYHLNEGQALLIAALSKTEKAAEVRFMLISVFIEWRKGTLQPVRSEPPAAFEIDIQHAPLSAKTEFLRMVARFRGRETAVTLMPQLGLPDLDVVINSVRIAPGGEQCLQHLLEWRDEEGDRIRDLVAAANVHGKDFQKRLSKNGVRAILIGEPGILVATNTYPVRNIFTGTPWADGKHNACLRGLPGVMAQNPVKFDGYTSRTLFIPVMVMNKGIPVKQVSP